MRAALEEMVEHGYAGTTVERVAVRAGVAKTTIYRRWGSLDGVLADLMADQAAQDIPVPDEGNLAADLQALARAVVASLSDPAVHGAFASMLVAAIQQPAAREVFDRFLASRVARMTVVIDRAAARGEVPPDTDGRELMRTLAALLYSRIFLIGEPASRGLADAAAAMVTAAAREHQGNTAGTVGESAVPSVRP
jgi:AcrR family transcriptional regulator